MCVCVCVCVCVLLDEYCYTASVSPQQGWPTGLILDSKRVEFEALNIIQRLFGFCSGGIPNTNSGQARFLMLLCDIVESIPT